MTLSSPSIRIPEHEVEFSAIRAQGAGGQNVNKVSSAIHLRFDVQASSLPEYYKQRLLQLRDGRVTKDGIVVIKAQRFRTREKNRADALQRLQELVASVGVRRKTRVPTRPSRSAKARRLDEKSQHSRRKNLRGRVKLDE